VEIEEQVRKILAFKSVSIRPPSTAGAIYVGKTIWDGPTYIVQSVAGNSRHRPSQKSFRPHPEIGNTVKIELTPAARGIDH